MKKGYEFIVACYKNSDLGFVTLSPDNVVEADITFRQSSSYHSKDWRYADFEKLAKDLGIKNINVVLGGFHCFSCVEQLVNEIYKLNKNIIVDTDLTELFWSSAKYTQNWRIDKFNPDQKIERFLEFSTPNILKRNKENYSNPIWGISQEMLDKLDKQIESEIS